MVETQTLSLTMRPKKLSEIIGCDNVVSEVRSQLESGRLPTAWLFGGPLGSGKTTLARIISVSLQCTHGKPGEPCDACQSEYWDISEVNASELNGVNEMKAIVERAGYMPTAGRKKVIILDEAHRITEPAQNLLLKYFEGMHDHIAWIICTTEPESILPALRSRCLDYTVRGLNLEETNSLVSLGLKKAGSKLLSKPLAEALAMSEVQSPRLILMAVEKYVTGTAPELAAQVSDSTSVDTVAICKATVQGDWAAVSKLLAKATPGDGRNIRIRVVGWFRTILVKSSGTRANICADAIQELTKINVFENGLQLSATSAGLFKVCKIIKGD